MRHLLPWCAARESLAAPDVQIAFLQGVECSTERYWCQTHVPQLSTSNAFVQPLFQRFVHGLSTSPASRGGFELGVQLYAMQRSQLIPFGS